MIATLPTCTTAHGSIPCAANLKHRIELWVFALLLLLLNLPLLTGGSATALAFRLDAVARGEWWRIFTHPFVHISWYHFLLDGAAFLALYANLLVEQRWRRILFVAASAAGSLLVAVCTSPLIAAHGLCGLSGAAHGLMAVSALEMMRLAQVNQGSRKVALIGFIAVAAKCVFEASSGRALFTILHFDLLGTPIVACHAGGVVGGVVAVLLCRCARSAQTEKLLSRKDADESSGRDAPIAIVDAARLIRRPRTNFRLGGTCGAESRLHNR